MAFPTLASPARRKNSSMDTCNKLPYYEDLYGARDADEAFDRFPDLCEEETTSEDNAKDPSNSNSISTGFFNLFTTPERNFRSRRTSYGRSGTSNPLKDFTKRKRGSSVSSSLSSSSSQTSNFFKKFNQSRAESTRNTAWSPINAKGLTSKKAKKLLTPEKYGMFSSPPLSPESTFKQIMEQDPFADETTTMRSNADEEWMAKEATNYAGEAMDDLLGFGGLYNLDNGFPTLDEDVNSSDGMAGTKNLLPLATTAQSEFDGDVEDNASETGDRENNNGEGDEISRPEIKKRVGSVVAVRKNKDQKSSVQPRRSLRQEQITQTKNVAEKQARRQARRVQPSKTKAAEVMVKNRSKMTARAASLRSKAKKGIAKLLPKSKSAGNLRARNWKGNAFDDEEGSVVVFADEVNPTEYIRC